MDEMDHIPPIFSSGGSGWSRAKRHQCPWELARNTDPQAPVQATDLGLGVEPSYQNHCAEEQVGVLTTMVTENVYYTGLHNLQ